MAQPSPKVLGHRHHGFDRRVRRAPIARKSASSGVRPEIQALRAIAVATVAVYHFWPHLLPGGYIGVDVFFVISGFLITTLLLKEVDRTGSVSMAQFWARRARRILPAALFVLIVSALVTVAFVPFSRWEQFFAEMQASTTYAQNWHLAAAAVDYSAADNAPTALQHYWSLSAEEQFYLVWPALILLAAVAMRISRRHKAGRRPIALVLATLTIASLAYGIYDTQADAATAYFITPTRAWEFGLGGLLALVQPLDNGPQGVRSAMSWLGLVAIAIAAAGFSSATPFPGVAALVPVLGAIVFILAGAPAHRTSLTPVLATRPVQFVGDVSYGVYLWHWPLLIVAPFVLGRALDTPTKVVILVLTLIASWLTKLLIEDPVRHGPLLTTRKPRWTLGLTAVATGLVMAVALGGSSVVHARIARDDRAAAAVLAGNPKCFGAAARDAANPCENPKLKYSVVPSPAAAAGRPNAPCTITAVTPMTICEFGVPRRKATATIALVGDSHAGHWRAAVAVTARRRGWHGISITRSGCPLSRTVKELRRQLIQPCIAWNRTVPRWLARHPSIHTLFVAYETGQKWRVPSGRSAWEAEVAGFERAWKALPRSIQHIVVLHDTPKVRETTSTCIERATDQHRVPGRACAVPRREAFDRDAQAAAAKRLGSKRVQVVDMTRFICDRTRCYPVVGGALVYKDTHHLTVVFATTLGPFLDQSLTAL